MLQLCHIPKSMKRGTIITLHKGGNKNKADPNSYRAITLLPTILKLYESVLLNMSENRIREKLNRQQGGFQKQLGCIMTSFLVKETILFNREYGSKVYVCFLDARQAFDRVWYSGLFLKLSECNIDDNVYYPSLICIQI